MKLHTILLATFVAAGAVQAGEVNDTNIIDFQGGLPALAADVNGNFDELITQINDNDSRISALETVTPPAGGVELLTLDCSADAAALADAISNADISVGLEITVSGVCDPIVINRDHVSITGPATIVSNANGDTPVAVESAANIALENLTIDGQGLADYSLSALWDSSIVAEDLTVSGSADTSVDVVRSALRLRGTNSFSATGAKALNAGGGALVLVQSGSTTISSDADVISINDTALAGNEPGSVLNISGTYLEVHELAAFFIANGTVNVDDIELARSAVLDMQVEGTDSVSLTGNVLAILNSVINIEGEDNTQISTVGNFTIASGSIVQAVALDAASVAIGTGQGDSMTLAADAQFSVLGSASLEFDNSIANFGSLLRVFLGGAAANDSTFTISLNSILFSDNIAQAIPQGNVTCNGVGSSAAGVAFISSGNTFVNLCGP